MGIGRTVAVVVLCAAALAGTVRAGEPAQAREVQTRIEQVALFKNGVGYFVRKGELPEEPGRFVIRGLPASSHGTFWLTCDKEAGLEGLVAREVTRKEPTPAANPLDLLKANIGKRVKIYLTDSPVEGTLVAVTTEAEPPPPGPYDSGRAAPRRSYYRPTPAGERMALLETDDGLVGLRLVPGITRVDILDREAARTTEKEIKAVELLGGLSKAPRRRDLLVTYLAKGITWAPSYRIDISRPDTALVSAKAVVINEVEDLQDVTLQLVTGFPHLQFADVPSPLSMKLDLAQFFEQLTLPPQRRAVVRRDVTSQTVLAYAEATRRAALPEFIAGGLGEVVEDLFLYPLEKVTLAKGEVGYYPLFTVSVPYKHLYRWEVTDPGPRNPRYRSGDRSAEEPRQVVWHTIRLENRSDYPWTTAPAMTVAEERVLGQDTLTYTSVGATTTLRVTQAVGVAAEREEVELEREPQPVRLYGTNYRRVHLEGTLRVRNFKGEPIDLEVVKTITGKLVSTTPEASVTRLASGLKQVNPVNRLTWRLTVEAGGKAELKYRYTALVHP